MNSLQMIFRCLQRTSVGNVKLFPNGPIATTLAQNMNFIICNIISWHCNCFYFIPSFLKMSLMSCHFISYGTLLMMTLFEMRFIRRARSRCLSCDLDLDLERRTGDRDLDRDVDSLCLCKMNILKN